MEELIKIALVGTGKHPGSPLAGDDPVDGLLAAVPTTDREQHFLLRIAAHALYEQVGTAAQTDIAAVEPAPADEAPRCSPRLTTLLERAFLPEALDHLPEFIEALRTTGRNLPPEVLPAALGIKDVTLRETLLPVLGSRGRWLSRFQADWEWVQAGAAAISAEDAAAVAGRWEEGTIAERTVLLRRLRRADASAARALLEPNFAKEKADHRARFLECLEVGLEPADEPLLEKSLDDRSEAVRLAAAGLLARLPQSQLAARMQARADALLGGGRDGGNLQLQCSPPEEIEKDWLRDGVPKAPPVGRGKRAFWAEAVVGAVNPLHWTDRFAASPDECLDAVHQDNFSDAVIRGWTTACLRFGGSNPSLAPWAGVLWNYWGGLAARGKGQDLQEAVGRLQSLLSVLPAEKAEAAVGALFAAVGPNHPSILPLLALLQLLPRPWSDGFSLSYLETVRSVFARLADNSAYQWSLTLGIAGRAIPQSVFAAALQPWTILERDQAWSRQALQRELSRFEEVIHTRRQFFDEIFGSARPTP